MKGVKKTFNLRADFNFLCIAVLPRRPVDNNLLRMQSGKPTALRKLLTSA